MVKKKAPVKKAAKKAASKRPSGSVESAETTSDNPTKKTPVRRVAKKTPVRKTTKKASVAGARAPRAPRETNIHGYVDGTDSALIVEALLEGGADRKAVNALAAEKIAAANGLATRGGVNKNVPSLVSAILGNLLKSGYEVDSSFILNPPAAIASEVKKAQAAARRKAARAASS